VAPPSTKERLKPGAHRGPDVKPSICNNCKQITLNILTWSKTERTAIMFWRCRCRACDYQTANVLFNKRVLLVTIHLPSILQTANMCRGFLLSNFRLKWRHLTTDVADGN